MKLLSRGDKVKVHGIVTRIVDKKGMVDVAIKGSEREASVRMNVEDVKRRLWGR